MSLKLRKHMHRARERAIGCAERAAGTKDPISRAEWLDQERGWKTLVESYLFVEAAEKFVLDGNKEFLNRWETPSAKGALKTTQYSARRI